MSRADSILEELELFGVKLGLERIREVFRELGSPQTGLPAVLVAGTNGKGSTATVLASIVGAAGYRSGLYTSPHLESVEERIRVGGRAIDGERLGELLSRVVEAGKKATGAPPTYFEALTAAALLHFRAEGVELAVLEVGLGGRLDATNTCDPLLSLITSISFDHQWVLGDTLSLIATEKAGILRSGVPAVHWIEADEARAAVEARARELGAVLEDARSLASWDVTGAGGAMTLETRRARRRLELSLAGEHQLANVALAVVAAERLAGLGFPLVERGIERGVAAAAWPGRLERVALEGGRWVLLDGAHNSGSATALGRHLARLSEPCTMIFGALRDKPAGEMLGLLCPHAELTLLVRPDSERGLDAADLLAAVPENRPARACSTLDEALTEALSRDASGVLVCGSLYLVGEARRWLRRRYGRPPAAADLASGL